MVLTEKFARNEGKWPSVAAVATQVYPVSTKRTGVTDKSDTCVVFESTG